MDDDEHVLALVEAVSPRGTLRRTVHGFAANATLVVRSTDARHSQLQWSARSGGRRASRFALPRRASYLNPPTRRMGREES